MQERGPAVAHMLEHAFWSCCGHGTNLLLSSGNADPRATNTHVRNLKQQVGNRTGNSAAISRLQLEHLKRF